MAIECTAFMAASLDGFIAKPGGNLEWLSDPRYELGEEDFGYAEHFRSIDAIVMGRNTYEVTSSFDEWPYSGKSVYVLTSRELDIPSTISHEVNVLSGELNKVLSTIADNGHNRLYIDGGITIQTFVADNLLDEITITRIPILLGKGIPLFGELRGDINLTHLGTVSYKNGFVQSKYSIDRNA